MSNTVHMYTVYISQPFTYRHQSMARLSMSDLENQLMGDLDGILECFDINVSAFNNSGTEQLVFVDYQPNKRLCTSPNVICDDERFDFGAPVEFDDNALAEIIGDESIPLIDVTDDYFDAAFLECIEKWEDLHDESAKTVKDKSEPADSLLKNGKLFVPTDVDNRLSNKIANVSVLESVPKPQPSVLDA